MQENNELVVIAKESGLQENKVENLLSKFAGAFKEAKKIVEEVKGIVVTSEDQIEEMSLARESRLKLKDVRVHVEKTRKLLKEDSVREGKAIDGIANVIKALIIPVEQHLEEQEKFAEKLAQAKDRNTEVERTVELSKYTKDAEIYQLHPSVMSTETFESLLKTNKIAFEAEKLATEKLEEERIAREKAEAEKQEEIRRENIKLKKEAEEREKKELEATKKREAEEAKRLEAQKKIDDKIAADRAEAEKKHQEALRVEREAKELAEKKLRDEKLAIERVEVAKKAKEEAEKLAQEEADKKAILAPDKIKLLEFAKQLQSVVAPAIKSKEADIILERAMAEVIKAVNILQNGAKKL